MNGLVVHDAAIEDKWLPRIRDLGVLDDRFDPVSDGKRAEIRRTMLGE